MENKQLAIYIEGQTCIQDTVNNKTGKSSIYGKDVSEYPGAEIVPLDYACQRIDEVLKEKLRLLEPTEIDEERWDYALECLPPMQWITSEAGSTFKMSEMTSGDFTAGYIYLKSNQKYYSMNVRVKTTHQEMINACGLITV